MPIYEYYCGECHCVFSFLSRTLSVTKKPACPRCEGKLEKQVSQFSVTHTSKDGEGGDDELGDLPIDDAKLEQAMESMAGDIEGLDEENPRQAAEMMRKFSRLTGLEFNENIQEALSRMEAGEDPEAVETEMGDALDDGDPFVLAGKGKVGEIMRSLKRRMEPEKDPALYEL